MPTIDATIGGANANSYETTVEAQVYFDSRLTVDGWENGDQDMLLIMATRTLNALLMPHKELFWKGDVAYYRVRRTWTGTPASTTQALAWPRVGMYDMNGNAIPSNVIPQALKDAESELAGQLGNSDRTLDNDVMVQGLTSVRAGSVSLSFKDFIETHVIPDAVWNLMPASWFTDETIIPAIQAQFDVIA
jgi:hypothetical protein